MQFILAISPKHKTSAINDVIDLTSPAEAEDETMENDDIFCVKTKDIEEPKQVQVDGQRRRTRNDTIDDNIDNNTGKTRWEK